MGLFQHFSDLADAKNADLEIYDCLELSVKLISAPPGLPF